jgi:ADP-ribose pyrophosphatase
MCSAKHDKHAWTVLDDETVFDASPFVKVRKQRIRTDQGREVANYFKVDLVDFVICCARTGDGGIITLWQYKHGCGKYGLTFPAGVMEPGEDPETAIRRELLEETGYEARTLTPVGRFAVNGNQGCGWANVFFLDGCHKVAEANSGDLERTDICVMTEVDIETALRDGAISLLAHAAVWGLFRNAQRGV